jgi:LPXTG-site transpeptidase (sortase) family protein
MFASLVILVLGGLLLVALNPLHMLGAPTKVKAVAPAESSRLPKAKADVKKRWEYAQPVPVPDIPYNATEEEAEKLLESEGLELGEVKEEHNSEYEKGGVFWQDPLPGVEVKRDSPVGITLSKGPEGAEDGIPDPPTDDLYLTVPKLGLYDNVVADTEDPLAMDNGAIKLPSTAFPWQDNGNTYIAAHRVGYSGTPSYNQFYDLPSMQNGDEVILSDANGTTYTYEVTDVFAVMPHENWVTDPMDDRDMVTLQTCIASVDDWSTITPGLLTSPPGPETARLVVQANRVDVQPVS